MVKLLEQLEESGPLPAELSVKQISVTMLVKAYIDVSNPALKNEEHARIHEEMAVKGAEALAAVTVDTFLSAAPEVAHLKLQALMGQPMAWIVGPAAVENVKDPKIMVQLMNWANEHLTITQLAKDNSHLYDSIDPALVHCYTSFYSLSLCAGFMPDFDRIPELAAVSTAIHLAFPDWQGTGKPFESGKLTSGSGPISWISDWCDAASSDVNIATCTARITHAFANPNTSLFAAWSGDLDLSERLERQFVRLEDVDKSMMAWFGQMFGVARWWTFHSDSCRRNFSSQDKLYAGPGESAMAALLAGFPYDGVMVPGCEGCIKTSLVYACLVNGQYDASCEIVVPPPAEASTLYFNCDGWQDTCFPYVQALHNNYQCAEICMQLGRFDEALAHAEHYEKVAWGSPVPVLAPWLKARILGRKAKVNEAADSDPIWLEVTALLERAYAASLVFEAPLLTAMALKEQLALVPEQARGADVLSRLEEARFELTMDTVSPLKSFVEDDTATFAPRGEA